MPVTKGHQLAPSGPSRLYRDMELRAFLGDCAERTLTINAVRDLIREKFGESRTPSRSAVARYLRRCRLARGIDFNRVE